MELKVKKVVRCLWKSSLRSVKGLYFTLDKQSGLAYGFLTYNLVIIMICIILIIKYFIQMKRIARQII